MGAVREFFKDPLGMQELGKTLADVHCSYLDQIKEHGSAKAALKHLLESGEYRAGNGVYMQTLQQLQLLAYAEDNGWKVKEGP